MQKHKVCTILNFSLAALLTLSVGCTQPFSKREQAGLVGGGIGQPAARLLVALSATLRGGALIGGSYRSVRRRADR